MEDDDDEELLLALMLEEILASRSKVSISLSYRRHVTIDTFLMFGVYAFSDSTRMI